MTAVGDKYSFCRHEVRKLLKQLMSIVRRVDDGDVTLPLATFQLWGSPLSFWIICSIAAGFALLRHGINCQNYGCVFRSGAVE